MNTLEVKKKYLEFMAKRGWPVKPSEKLVDSTFPHCFTISGAVDYYNRKLATDSSGKDAHVYTIRCLRHFDAPDETHLPFFWMLLCVSWSLHSREKVIADNFDFMKEMGLDPKKLKITYWQGEKVYGKDIELKADVEKLCRGPEFEKMQKEGIPMPEDKEAKDAWKKCGIQDTQLVACGEVGTLDPTGHDSVLLNAREHFAGVRSEPFYKIKDELIEIGVFLSEGYVKKPTALKLKLPQEILEDKIDDNKFLLRLKPKPTPGGFGLERITMAINSYTTVFELEPYKNLKDILMSRVDKLSKEEEAIIEQTIPYITAIIWLVHDGAHLLTTNKFKARRGIYRKILKGVIQNLEKIGLDNDEIYRLLLNEAIDYFLQDSDYSSLTDILPACLEEINKQKERIEIEKEQLKND